jgi:hypothetical protein
VAIAVAISEYPKGSHELSEIADASGEIVLILPLAEAAGISVHRSV